MSLLWLNKNDSHRPIKGGTVRRCGLVAGVMALLERGVCQWGRVLSYQMLKSGTVRHSSFLLLADLDVELLVPLHYHVFLHAVMLPAMVTMD